MWTDKAEVVEDQARAYIVVRVHPPIGLLAQVESKPLYFRVQVMFPQNGTAFLTQFNAIPRCYMQ